MAQQFDTPRPWQQYYPTHSFVERDILLAEYKSASDAAAAEEKLFLSSGNIAFVVAAGVSSVALGSLDEFYKSVAGVVSPRVAAEVLVGLLLCFSLLTLKHFAERQKAIQLAKRKIVVLRSMLGLDYGSIQLVLPSWRLEGASQPFAIRLFAGWGSYPAYPFWVTGLFSSVVLFFVSAQYFGLFVIDPVIYTVSGAGVAFAMSLAWLMTLGLVYRSALFDTHETPLLSAARAVARILDLQLVESTEYTLYRGKLAYYELERLNFDIVATKMMLLFVEDRDFLRHKGVSFKGMARAARDYAFRGRMSGGSTITQQLARSLFVVQYSKTYRRKIVETILAIWLETQFDKETLLKLYLTSVRFDDYVFGIPAAIEHFFGAPVRKLTPAQSFFLIERISNIRKRILVRRVDSLVTQACRTGLLVDTDLLELSTIYSDQVTRGLVPDDQVVWGVLKAKWTSGVNIPVPS
ncbi:MAG: biosynthetic peptidoglycan transglycosylase [Gemmatimonadales bacterium]